MKNIKMSSGALALSRWALVGGAALLVAVACGGDDSKGGDGDGDGDGDVPATGGTTGNTGGTTGNTGGTTGNTGGTTGGDGDWLDAADAGLTIGLGAYTYKDTGGSTITLTAPGGGELCATGTALGHNDGANEGDFQKYWGAGIGISFADVGETYDISSETSFSFTVDPLPEGEFRVGFVQASDTENSFYVVITEAGDHTIDFADLAQGSWVMPPGTFDPTTVRDLQFQVSSVATDTPYDFCVSNIKIGDLTNNMGGAGGE